MNPAVKDLLTDARDDIRFLVDTGASRGYVVETMVDPGLRNLARAYTAEEANQAITALVKNGTLVETETLFRGHAAGWLVVAEFMPRTAEAIREENREASAPKWWDGDEKQELEPYDGELVDCPQCGNSGFDGYGDVCGYCGGTAAHYGGLPADQVPPRGENG